MTKKSRKKAMDYTSGYLELKECREEFLTDSAKVQIDLFQSNQSSSVESSIYFIPKG